ncbi:hypothetical protein [Halovenus marina]|uniref:hypothetical protein n=1 Tax=Halovenus marina TaxID=3396621 RepID=UPI003F55610F
MGCDRCGCPTPRSRLCKECGRDEHRSTGPVGGTASDQNDRDDEWQVEQQGLGDADAQGQSTLDGGVAKDGGDR